MRFLEINLLALIMAVSLQNIECKMDFAQLSKAGKAFRKSCQRESNCPTDLITNARLNGDFPPVPELKCYFKCLFQAMKIIRDDKFSEEAMNSQMALMLTEDLAKSLDAMAAHCIPQTLFLPMMTYSIKFYLTLYLYHRNC
ncbi:general odorant-binding protein 19a-like isoform X2 [Belonocnema kinseyi]|uniref:general odorant-binding protein 19a-like isoform X2 n=1 Tax=Belonocnema kinseyi TaxID=2817044 RepID=UPI00143E05A2|nr:general odorant-binding protein 19a-like isoform X2 [Belonocnema kinseyi]